MVGDAPPTPSICRDPQGHAVVDEQREGEGELIVVEGALRLPNDHRAEAAVWLGESVQELAGLGCRRSWKAAA